MSNNHDINKITSTKQNPRSMKLFLLLSLAIIFASTLFFSQSFIQNPLYFHNVYGHALPVTYSPAPNSIINKNESLPSKVTISFSERPDPKVSYIQVLNSNNQRIDNNDFKITGQQHDREATVTLDKNKLTDGVYTVSWLTMSADDGHIAKGSYVFGIGNVGGYPSSTNTANPSLKVQSGSAISTNNNNNNNFAQQNQVKTEAVTSNLDGIIKWPLIVAQAAIVGGIISHLFFWNNNKFVNKLLLSTNAENKKNINSVKSVKHENVNTNLDDNNGNQIEKIRFKPLQIFVIMLCTSSIAIFVCGTALFLLQINNLSNSNSNFFSLAGSLLYDSVGKVWMIRSLAFIIVIVTSLSYYFLEKRKIKRESEKNYENQKIDDSNNAKNKRNQPIFLLYLALVAGAICIFANSMISHNSAVSFLPSIAISLDWLHFMAVSVWVGGLFYISTVLLVLVKSHISLDVVGLNGGLKRKSRTSLNSSHMQENDKLISSSESTETNEKYSPISKGDYFLALLLPRFSLLAIISLGIIGVSGLYMAWIHLHSFTALLDTSYGIILIIKLLTALPVVVLGGYHQITLHNYMVNIALITRRGDKSKNTIASIFKKEAKKQTILLSTMNKVMDNGRFFNYNKRFSNGNKNDIKDHENRITSKDSTRDIYSRFSKTIKIESLLGIVVLFVASILTITSPPSMNMSSSIMMMGNSGNGNINTNIIQQNQNNNNGQKATTMVLPSITGSHLSPDSTSLKNLNTSTPKVANNSYLNNVKILDTNTKTEINPLYAGFNTFKITFTGMDGKPAKNITNVVMQFTNDQANIGSIVVNLKKISEGVYSIFGGYLSQKGNWSVQTTAQRTGAYDLNNEFNVNIQSLPSSTTNASLSSIKTTLSPSQQQQKSSLGSVNSNNSMNQSESPPSFDSFAILAFVLAILVISASAYFFKKSKQQLKETTDMFEKQD